MPSQSESKYQEIKNQLVKTCEDIAGHHQIIAICLAGDYASRYPNTNEIIEILLVIRDFQPRLTTRIRTFGDKNIIIFCVDEWIFEKDVEKGFLGEAIAEKIIFPYTPLKNADYLHLHEVKLKKRMILELLENLVLGFPELSYSFHIRTEYFIYETIMSRARLFPPMIHSLASFLKEDVKNRNIAKVTRGYKKALKKLEEENVITFSNGYVKICQEFVERVETSKVRFVNLFRTAQKALFTSFLGTFSKTVNLLSKNRDFSFNFQRLNTENLEFLHQLEDPQRYLYIPTAHGLISLSNKMNIEGFARKVLPIGKEAEIDIEKIGGVLNDVYLVKGLVDEEEKKIVVKRFKDWSSFKWFPLNLWTLGTKAFAVLARSRLEKECAINQLLHSKGFEVPQILHVSHVERLVFKEYIEGEKFDGVIRNILKSENKNYLEAISKVGKTFAEAHALDIALGDTKPENIMLKAETDKIYLLDLEQASRKGDKVWDIAEFLYYSGHYIPPWAGTRPAQLITEAFISGYLQAGGDSHLLKRASNPKYTKVFSIFTLPHIILTISTKCRKTGENEKS